MVVTPIKTRSITVDDKDIFSVLDEYLQDIPEKTVVAITSKIVSICEGRVVPIERAEGGAQSAKRQKDELIEEEAQWYLHRSESKYNVSFAVRDNILAPSAGIDESNGNGYYILWPENPQESANKIRENIANRLSLREIGVIITDSKTTPMRWGVTGLALAHSGFQAVNNYIGKKDLFGREFEYEKVNVMDSLAASAVYVMGEGAESTPLAIVTDIPLIVFQDRNPTEEELKSLTITLEDDIYSPFLKNAPWRRGKAK
jgi:dihydrofolate synthase / folylpolyglutamate synthase